MHQNAIWVKTELHDLVKKKIAGQKAGQDEEWM